MRRRVCNLLLLLVLASPLPRDSRQYFTVPIRETPQPGSPGPRIYIPQQQGGPDIPPGTGFPFGRLLRLAGLWLRYSIPPSHGNLSTKGLTRRQLVAVSKYRPTNYLLKLRERNASIGTGGAQTGFEHNVSHFQNRSSTGTSFTGSKWDIFSNIMYPSICSSSVGQSSSFVFQRFAFNSGPTTLLFSVDISIILLIPFWKISEEYLKDRPTSLN
jgi:hypothetical protein